MAKQERLKQNNEVEQVTRRRLRIPQRSNQLPAPVAGQPLIGGHTGKTPNFTRDLDRLAKQYSGMKGGERRENGQNTSVYLSPKKM